MNTDVIDIVAGFAETGIDAAIKDDILKDIPLVSTAISLARLSKTARDHYFLRRIGAFFGPLSELAISSRFDLLAKLDKDAPFKEKLSELTAVYLDKYDTAIKARYLGILMIACLEKRINHDHFFRMAYFLDRAFWGDLEHLKDYNNAGTKGIIQPLSAVQMDGFLVSEPLVLEDENDTENIFRAGFIITPLGKELLSVISWFEDSKYITG